MQHISVDFVSTFFVKIKHRKIHSNNDLLSKKVSIEETSTKEKQKKTVMN